MAEIHQFPDGGEPIRYAEDTLALQFAEMYAPSMRYVSRWGKWLQWNGSVWVEDSTLDVFDKVRAICRVEAEVAKAEAQRKGANDATRIGRKLLDGRTIASVEKLARSDRRLAATVEQWDAEPWALNTPDGAVNLGDGTLLDPRPEDYFTRCTAVGPIDHPPEMWHRFLYRITAGDAPMLAYLQRLCGYALTGLTIEHALFFLYGTGANGKSVLLNTVAGIMGNYARSASLELFLQTKHDQHPTAIAGLAGARLVTVTETEKGGRWAEAKIKALTGGDRVAARFMRQDFFEFLPQFKLVIAGNHRPAIRGVDEAMRRRMNLVPFTTTIPEDERDPDLFEKLKAEWPQILNWMVEGCLSWHREKLSPPPSVTSATETYLEAEDALGQWMNEKCDFANNHFALAADLYANWKTWCEVNGEYDGSAKVFSQSLEERGLKRQREAGTGKRGFLGAKLREETLI